MQHAEGISALSISLGFLGAKAQIKQGKTMKSTVLKAVLAGAATALGLAASSVGAVTLPTCIPGVTCLVFGDFNVFSLPLLNLQATGDAVPKPGDPYFFSSTYGQIQNFTIVGINNGQSTSTGNPPGSVDGAFNTPSQNNTTNVAFTTLTPGTDPGGTGQFLGDIQAWDAKTPALLSLINGTPLTAFFAFNETGSGTGLLTTDLLIWASATLQNMGTGASTTFYLGGAGAPPSILPGDLPAPDGTDATGTNNPGTPAGFGPWVYVHAGICVSGTTFVGFPDVNGNCATGTVANQNNLGQNAAAFMVNSPALDAALDSTYNCPLCVLHITWEMAYINGGGETAWIQPAIAQRLPEPGALAITGLVLLAFGVTTRRFKK